MNDDDEIAGIVSWLRRESDLLTNSLHCGDSSITINAAHNRAAKFDRAASIIENLRGECAAIVAARL